VLLNVIERLYDTVMKSAAVEIDVEEELADIAGHLNVQHARLVRIVSRAGRDGGWVGYGIQSIRHWLTIQLGVAPGVAKKVATIAERVDDFPLLVAAFARGELSVDQVYEVAARAPAWADSIVTNFALVATVPQLRRMIRDENFEGDPEEPPAEPAAPSDSLGFGWDEHSRLQIFGALDAEQGSIVEGGLNEVRDALFREGHTGTTWADAMVEMARRSLDAAPADRRRRFMPNVHLHTDTGAAQLTNGVPLPPAIRDYLLCDSLMRPVWERDNVPVGYGRSQHTVPLRLRRLVEHRDQGCRVPGCGARHVQVHHMRHWEHGGVTETWNLVCLCPRHHKLHHVGQLFITGNPDQHDGLTFTDAKERTLATHPKPQPPTEPPPSPAVPYQHPSGERLQPKWIGLGWVHPNAIAQRKQRLQLHYEHTRQRRHE
jgi:hypothetical protein